MDSQEECVFETQQSIDENINYTHSNGLGDSVGPHVQSHIPNNEQLLYLPQFKASQIPLHTNIGLNRVNVPHPHTAHEIYGSGFPFPSHFSAQIPFVDTQVSNTSKKSKNISVSSPLRQSQSTQPCNNYRFWSIEEDVALTKAYLYISVDSIVGKDQTSSKLWDRILKVWRDHMGTYNEKRGCNSLSCRWNTIQTAVCKFHSLYESLERAPRSGTTIVDMKREALNMYRELGDGTPFKFEHCWEIMKDNPKWCSAQLTKTSCPKKTKNANASTFTIPSSSTQKAPEISSSNETDHTNIDNLSSEKEIDDDGLVRPLGRKGSKEKRRKLNEQKTMLDALNSFQSTLEQQNLVTQQNLKLRQQMLEKNLELKEKAHQLKVEAQVRKQIMEKRKEQERILNIDLNK